MSAEGWAEMRPHGPARVAAAIRDFLLAGAGRLAARPATWLRHRRMGFRVLAVVASVALAMTAAGSVRQAQAATTAGIPITWPGGDMVASYDYAYTSPATVQDYVTNEWPAAAGLSPDPSLSDLFQATWKLVYGRTLTPPPQPPIFTGGSVTVSADGNGGSIVTFDIPAADFQALEGTPDSLVNFVIGVGSALAGAIGGILAFSACGGMGFPGGNTSAASKKAVLICSLFGAGAIMNAINFAMTTMLNTSEAGTIPAGLFWGAVVGGIASTWLTTALPYAPMLVRTFSTFFTYIGAVGAWAKIVAFFASFMSAANVNAVDIEMAELANVVNGQLAEGYGPYLEMGQWASALGQSTQGTIPNGAAGSTSTSSANCMDAYGSNGAVWPTPGAAPGQKVAINTCNGNPAQSWIMWGNGSITVWGLCLDSNGSSLVSISGTQYAQATLQYCDGSSSQVWYTYAGELVNAYSQYCLDDPETNTDPGTQLILYPCGGTPNQLWALPSAAQYVSAFGTVTADISSTTYCMDAYGSNGGASPGQRVAINNCDSNPAQSWTVGTNGSVLVWGLCLDDANGGTDTDGDPLVTLQLCDGAADQLWTVNGKELVNANDGLCLDDPGSNTAPGTQLITFPCKNGPNEQWVLPGSKPSPGKELSGSVCDIYESSGTPCVAAYSLTRALYSGYDGPLYQVTRVSDNTTANIGLLMVGGDVAASEQDSFCAGTTCTITEIYDQSPDGNNLTVEGAGGNGAADQPAVANALPITIGNNNEAYGLDVEPGIGYRDDGPGNAGAVGVAEKGAPEGMYMVASGTHVNSGCCYDFGNAETDNHDDGVGRMDAVNLTTNCGNNNPSPCSGGPWVEADMENGQWTGGNSSNIEPASNSDFVTAMLSNDGQSTFELQGGNSQSGGLTTFYDGPLPSQYQPMDQEGGIVLGTGGDNSQADEGSFFEGVMTAGFPSAAADAAVQANIVAAGYLGDSDPAPGADSVGAAPGAAGQAVVHSAGATGAASSGFSSVYTVNSANGDLQETYLPYMGDNWTTQDLSDTGGTLPGTPPVMPGTQPVALVHCGFTSVYTVDAGSGDLQETYLPAIGDAWVTQDLSANYHTPPTDVTPTAVEHSAGAAGATPTCGYTSVYTVDRGSYDLQETYLSNDGFPGDAWYTQDLSDTGGTLPGTPAVQEGTSPVAIVHCGYTSVYTVDQDHQLQETYLPAIGGPWYTQSLSAKYYTPDTTTTPTVVVHAAGATGTAAACGFTSVYTVDDPSRDLQETYLPVIGGPWTTQDLSDTGGTLPGTPPVAPGTAPVALVHMGFTSVYTVDEGSDQLQETYLPAISDSWSTQDLSDTGGTLPGTPTTDQTPIVLLHPDASGVLDWTSVYTVDEFSDHLQETYLSNAGFPGDAWVTQDLSAKYYTPEVAATDDPTAGWSVVHDGYTSVYTVDASDGDLQETYLTAMGQPWATQNLSTEYEDTPKVLAGTAAVAVVHDGYTSVYTIDAGDSTHTKGDLQETYLPAIGGPWYTQDLSTEAGTPASAVTPTAVFHSGYTSVYTVEASNGDLWETYLPAAGFPGDSWVSQNLSGKYFTPSVETGTSPVAVFHDGYTSVYTVDAAAAGSDGGDLQETYLPAIGDAWTTQDLSSTGGDLPGTPQVNIFTSPTAVVHNGYVSVYTVDAITQDASKGDLQETYLPAIGDAWATQDLSSTGGDLPGTPQVEAGMAPVALYHTGYTSVYTIDAAVPVSIMSHLQETYLPAIGGPWSTQDLSAKYHTPNTKQAPTALLHYDTDGGLTWTSVYSIDDSGNLWETYLPAMGDSWTAQNLSSTGGTMPGTPPVSVQQPVTGNG